MADASEDARPPEGWRMVMGVDTRPLPASYGGPQPAHSEAREAALARGRATAALLQRHPSLLARARGYTQSLLDASPDDATMAEWLTILDSYSGAMVGELLGDTSERSERLRLSSPFFPVLSSEERDEFRGILQSREG